MREYHVISRRLGPAVYGGDEQDSSFNFFTPRIQLQTMKINICGITIILTIIITNYKQV